MGAVYLGKDPKISRTVAIKTMALSQEFEEDELVEVTPSAIRLRKRYLDPHERKRASRLKESA